MAKGNHKEAGATQGTPDTASVTIGMSACGLAAGADQVYRTFVEEVGKRNLPVEVHKCGCVGMCYAEPLVEVQVGGLPTVTYGKVDRDMVFRILERHIIGKTLINDFIYGVRTD